MNFMPSGTVYGALPPPSRPRTLLALGLNHADHMEELEFQASDEPLVFSKGEGTVSDNAGMVPGGRTVSPQGIDRPWGSAILRQNGLLEDTGLAAGVLGHPPVAAKTGARFDAGHGPLGRFEFNFV